MVTEALLKKSREFSRDSHGTTSQLLVFVKTMQELKDLENLADTFEDGNPSIRSELIQKHFFVAIDIEQASGWVESEDWGMPKHYAILYGYAAERLAEFERKYNSLLQI
ncbi:MAG: hypothetical protein KKF56_03210 [Nanoarchaeota archaeon]|nr:hypothetical protein [Nanoarchaeota archaeon]